MAVSISGSGAITGMVSADSSDLSTELDAKLDTPGAWTSYTPSVTGVTVGDGTLAGQYIQVGSIVHYRISLVFGSTTALSGTPDIGLPVAKAGVGASVNHPVGWVHFQDASASNHEFGLQLGNGRMITGTGTYGYWNSTAPFTWASGDSLYASGTYEAA